MSFLLFSESDIVWPPANPPPRGPSAYHPNPLPLGQTGSRPVPIDPFLFIEKKILIRAAVLGQRTERDDVHFLDRWQQVVVMRQHTGHNRLNAFMLNTKKLAPSPTCSCGPEDQTAEHLLQSCPLLRTARTNVWPALVQLHTKLFGSKEELEKTATFILQTGISV